MVLMVKVHNDDDGTDDNGDCVDRGDDANDDVTVMVMTVMMTVAMLTVVAMMTDDGDGVHGNSVVAVMMSTVTVVV